MVRCSTECLLFTRIFLCFSINFYAFKHSSKSLDNNFVTEDACLQRCEQKQPPTPPPQQQPQPQQPSEGDQLEPFRPEHCMLPSETGPCRALQPKYYYNSRDGVCDVFGYGGCNGNQNKFDTAEECESKCGNVQDLCGLPPVRGRCQENVTRYYYDARSDQCLTFEYSGCRGNRNVSKNQECFENFTEAILLILELLFGARLCRSMSTSTTTRATNTGTTRHWQRKLQANGFICFHLLFQFNAKC